VPFVSTAICRHQGGLRLAKRSSAS
jgi:hypothetical protein